MLIWKKMSFGRRRLVARCSYIEHCASVVQGICQLHYSVRKVPHGEECRWHWDVPLTCSTSSSPFCMCCSSHAAELLLHSPSPSCVGAGAYESDCACPVSMSSGAASPVGAGLSALFLLHDRDRLHIREAPQPQKSGRRGTWQAISSYSSSMQISTSWQQAGEACGTT